MAEKSPSVWQEMTEAERERVIAILVAMLLRQATSETGEVSHERGE